VCSKTALIASFNNIDIYGIFYVRRSTSIVPERVMDLAAPSGSANSTNANLKGKKRGICVPIMSINHARLCCSYSHLEGFP
jgi:hypothetical protein